MSEAGRRIWFGTVVFSGAFLLFLVEPMAAKELLPRFGGAASVWMTCLVFFQVALLAGYAYGHWMVRAGRGWIHTALLLLAVLCAVAWAVFGMKAAGGGAPGVRILLALAGAIGAPFILLSATGPMLQVWWQRVGGSGVPYRLFGLSNFASLLALALYPLVVEPWLPLRMQRGLWACGVALFAACSGALARRVFRTAPLQGASASGARTPNARRWMWFILPMAGAMQLSAVTGYLTSNVAAIPLLWVLPLGVYLVSFIVAFDAPRLYHRVGISRLLLVVGFGLCSLLSHTTMALPIGLGIGFLLLELAIACWFLHAEVYALRPQGGAETTLFYLMLAGGGASGTVLVGLVAPVVFRMNYDLPIVLLVTAGAGAAALWREGRAQRVVWTAAALGVAGLLVVLYGSYHHGVVMATRNFYGSLRVRQTVTPAGDTKRVLMNGTINHGDQIFSDTLRRVPGTYFAEDTGAGLALRGCCPNRVKRIGIVGLGVGTLAAYGNPGDTFRFYEINPSVEPVARNLFSYLRESGARVDVIEGDGRALLEREPPRGFDVLVLDAFTGDAIPLHLLTREALKIYRRQLAPDGIMAFHVSNQYVDLAAEVGALARDAGLQARVVKTGDQPARGELTAEWVLVSTRQDLPGAPVARRNVTPWTDEYSSLARVMRWR